MSKPLHLALLLLLLLLAVVPPAEPFFLPFFRWPFAPFDQGKDQVPNAVPDVPPPAKASPNYATNSLGTWELVIENSGVSAMHMVITKNNKAIMFDSTVFGPSQIPLPEGEPCRPDPTGRSKVEDCWAHAVEFDLETSNLRPLKVSTDTWCSSGSFDAEGTLVQTGGWRDGGKAVRYLQACDTCDWQEYPTALTGQRWYATQQVLPDGRYIVVGGRRMFNYEYVPAAGTSNTKNFNLPLLRETTDEMENNLYPFVHLSTDGTVFIFANNRAILLDPITNKVVRELPALKGGSRNYPASAQSAIIPIDLSRRSHKPGATAAIPTEVIICGGAAPNAAKQATKKIFLPALRSCGRIVITDPNATWHLENMPVARVMSDMLLLPNAEILIINGAGKGTAGWHWATGPVFEPLLYRPSAPRGERFTTLAPSEIPRMYHSTSAVLPDASILVAGSNPNSGYNFTAVEFPTELRVEKFYPPYLDPLLAIHRPKINAETAPATVGYGASFTLEFSTEDLSPVEKADIKVTMYAPPFTTHGFSMNQRLLILVISELESEGFDGQRVTVAAPPSSVVAPAGYYLMFVVNRGVPSSGVWVQVK